MKQIAKVEKAKKTDIGTITNIAVAAATLDPAMVGPDWIDCPPGAGIGWTWDGTTATPPIEPVHPVSDIGALREEGLERRDWIFKQQLERKTGQPFRNGAVTFALLGQYLIALHEEKAKTTDFFTNQASITGEDPAQLLATAAALSKDVFGFLGAAWGYYRIATTKIKAALGEDEIKAALQDFGNQLAILASAQTAVHLPSPPDPKIIP